MGWLILGGYSWAARSEGALLLERRPTLDRYSKWISPEDYSYLKTRLSASRSIPFKHLQNRFVIGFIDARDGVRFGGLQEGDILVSIDGTWLDAFSKSAVEERLQWVVNNGGRLGYERDGFLEETIVLPMSGSQVEFAVQALTEGVGLIRLPTFDVPGLASKVLASIEGNNRAELRGLILDLRGNAGGLFTESILLADLFLSAEPIAILIESDGRRVTLDAMLEAPLAGTPLVVLVDSNTASSAELFAGTIQSSGAGVVIGQPTFGKSSIQTVYPMETGGAVLLTDSRYLLPTGESLSSKGIQPDIRVGFKDDFDFFTKGDPGMNAGVRYLQDRFTR